MIHDFIFVITDQMLTQSLSQWRTAFGHVITVVINSFILIKILLLITSKPHKKYQN